MSQKRDFLCLLKEEIVKKLTKISVENVGMRNEQMGVEIGKFIGELETKCGVGDSVKDNAGIKVKEEKATKNDSLSDTIKRLSAGFPVNTGDFKVKEEVVIGEPNTGTYYGKKSTSGGL